MDNLKNKLDEYQNQSKQNVDELENTESAMCCYEICVCSDCACFCCEEAACSGCLNSLLCCAV